MKSIWKFLLTSTSCCHPSGFKNRDRLVRKCPECCFGCSREILALWNLWIESTLKLLGKVSADSAWDALHSRWVRSTKRALDEHRCSACVNLLQVFSVDTHDVLLHVVILCYFVDSCFMIYEYLWWVIYGYFTSVSPNSVVSQCSTWHFQVMHVRHVRCPSMLTFYEDIYISELRDELSKVRRLWAKGPWGVDPHLREQTWTTNDCRCW